MIDAIFTPEEMLYRRIEPNALPISQVTMIRIIPFPDCSVNRSKYSQPQDVLLPDYLNWGVLGFAVQYVPKELSASESYSRFDVVHCPLSDNYAHSEIRSYKTGTELKEPSKTIKMLFRDEIRKNARVILEPSNAL
jgi:hypothetical protein